MIFSCMTPAGTSNELDVQNEWDENTHTRNIHIRCGKSVEFLDYPYSQFYRLSTAARIII